MLDVVQPDPRGRQFEKWFAVIEPVPLAPVQGLRTPPFTLLRWALMMQSATAVPAVADCIIVAYERPVSEMALSSEIGRRKEKSPL
jgi:hypothetical protein